MSGVSERAVFLLIAFTYILPCVLSDELDEKNTDDTKEFHAQHADDRG